MSVGVRVAEIQPVEALVSCLVVHHLQVAAEDWEITRFISSPQSVEGRKCQEWGE